MAKATSSWSSHEIEIIEIMSVALIKVELKLSSGALKVHLEFSQHGDCGKHELFMEQMSVGAE